MLRVASVFGGIGAFELVAMSDDFFKSELEKKFSNIIN